MTTNNENILGTSSAPLLPGELIDDRSLDSADGDEFSRRMDELGNRLLAAKQAYLDQRAHDDRLFGSRFTPDA